MKPLDPAARRALRAKAHHLHPVVAIGTQGLTPAVLHELDVNLLAHELVKLRVHSDDRELRESLLEQVCRELDAAPVQHLGKVLVIYRERPAEEEPNPRARAKKAPPRGARTAAVKERVERPPRSAAPRAAKTRAPTPAARTGGNAPPRPKEGKHPPRPRRRRG